MVRLWSSSFRRSTVIIFAFVGSFFIDPALILKKNVTDIQLEDVPGVVMKTNATASVNNDLSLITSEKTFIYQLWLAGLGSQILNMFAAWLLMDEYHNRTLIAVESQYGYRRNESHGLLTGFFQPGFPVVDTFEQHEAVERVQPGLNLSHVFNKKTARNVDRGNTKASNIWVAGVYEYVDDIARHYNVSSVEFFEKLAAKMCPHMMLNAVSQEEIDKHLREHKVPDFGMSRSSVAFHVRRGDKLQRESELFEGKMYVDKLLTTFPDVSFDLCFVATDDYDVVAEIRDALRDRSIDCHVYSVNQGYFAPPKHRAPTTYSDTVHLLSELEVMKKATYFIGAFNSNLCALTAVLRRCSRPSAPDFAHSYGVDQEWALRFPGLVQADFPTRH